MSPSLLLVARYLTNGLITNYGGATKWEGACEVLSLRKGGWGRKRFSHAEGGTQKVLG